MSAIVLVDTSILLNVLNVPGRNQKQDTVLAQLLAHIEAQDHLFLPLTAIIETGNHIAHINDGGLRRQAALRFVTTVSDSLNNTAPWKPLSFPNHSDVAIWLARFPDSATRQVGMGDVSIQAEWDDLCKRFPMSRVVIWSADRDLQGFDRKP